MAKQRKQECPAGAPLWLATYGDMMTLVLCFFVLMYSFANMDESKFEEFTSSFQNRAAGINIMDFGEAGVTDMLGNGLVEFPIPSEATDVTEEADDDYNNKIKGYIADMQGMLNEAYASPYETYFDKSEGTPEISVVVGDQIIELRIGSDYLFTSGSAELRAEFDITTLANIIKEKYVPGDVIVVEGHTDNVPMSANRKFANNWELSQGRASAVVVALMNATGLPGSSFETRGRSEYEPIADNSTAEGRVQNRRVVIYMKYSAIK